VSDHFTCDDLSLIFVLCVLVRWSGVLPSSISRRKWARNMFYKMKTVKLIFQYFLLLKIIIFFVLFCSCPNRQEGLILTVIQWILSSSCMVSWMTSK